jgi:hypothetical protein
MIVAAVCFSSPTAIAAGGPAADLNARMTLLKDRVSKGELCETRVETLSLLSQLSQLKAAATKSASATYDAMSNELSSIFEKQQTNCSSG